MNAREIMTTNVACCTGTDSIRHASQLMARNDCGCIPVIADNDNTRVIGVITDRDVALRAAARGIGPEARVADVMTADVQCCSADADLKDVERIMADFQVRRVPVVDDEGCCIGMIAQADLARDEEHADDHEVRQVIEAISEPRRSSGLEL